MQYGPYMENKFLRVVGEIFSVYLLLCKLQTAFAFGIALYVVCKRLNVIWLCCSFTSSAIVAVQKLAYLAVVQPLMSELRQKFLLD
jgi:hypothetical protein